MHVVVWVFFFVLFLGLVGLVLGCVCFFALFLRLVGLDWGGGVVFCCCVGYFDFVF